MPEVQDDACTRERIPLAAGTQTGARLQSVQNAMLRGVARVRV